MVSYKEFVRFLEGGGNGRSSDQLHYDWVINSKWFKDFKEKNKEKLPADFETKFKTAFLSAFNNKQFTANNNATTSKEGFINYPKNQEVLNNLANKYIQYNSTQPQIDYHTSLYNAYAQNLVNSYINNPSNKLTSTADDFIANFKNIFNQYIDENMPKEPSESAYSTDEEFRVAKGQYQVDYDKFFKDLPTWISKTLPAIAGQSNETPEYNKEKVTNSEFSKISKEKIDEIGQNEVKNHLQDIRKVFKGELADGITNIEYLGIVGKVQESKKGILGSKLQEFKRLKEGAQTLNKKQENPVDTKNVEMINKIAVALEDQKRAQNKLPLPQTMIYRISFNSNTMYWVFRSYGNIRRSFEWAEIAESALKKIEIEKKEESLQGINYTSLMQETEKYINFLREANEEEDKLQEEAQDNNIDKIKINLSGIHNKGRDHFKDFTSSVEAAKEKIIKDLQDLRALEALKLPSNQQAFYPNFEGADDNSEENFYLNEVVANKLKEIDAEVKKLNIGEEEMGKEDLESILEALTKYKTELVQLSKDPNNCYTNIKINIIAGDKKPSLFKRIGANIGGKPISGSAKQWQSFLNGTLS